MSYTMEKWRKRFSNRSDLTLTLTHLTRAKDAGSGLSSVDMLIKILKERTILGSNGKGFIHGDNTAVCFQDAPNYGIAQNIIHEKEYRDDLGGKIRYSSDGLIFLKRYVYLKGGRPVFYENIKVAKKILPRDEWWRIVSYNIDDKDNIIDWTHEREWRVKGNFEFELKTAYVLLETGNSYREFMEKFGDEIKNGIAGITAILPVIR